MKQQPGFREVTNLRKISWQGADEPDREACPASGAPSYPLVPLVLGTPARESVQTQVAVLISLGIWCPQQLSSDCSNLKLLPIYIKGTVLWNSVSLPEPCPLPARVFLHLPWALISLRRYPSKTGAEWWTLLTLIRVDSFDSLIHMLLPLG